MLDDLLGIFGHGIKVFDDTDFFRRTAVFSDGEIFICVGEGEESYNLDSVVVLSFVIKADESAIGLREFITGGDDVSCGHLLGFLFVYVESIFCHGVLLKMLRFVRGICSVDLRGS